MNAAGEKVRVHWSKKVLLHCADNGKSHTLNTLNDTRDLSHALPTLTNSVLSASCGIHNYMTLSLLHNSHHRLSNSKFSLKLHAAQIISYGAHNIPLHITTVSGL